MRSMFYKVDFSTLLGRQLFSTLYERVMNFGVTECRDAESNIRGVMAQLMLGDPALALLVNLEGPTVTAHCLVKFNQLPDGTYEAFCSQLLVDGSRGDDFIQQCEAWASQFSGVSVFTMLTDERKYKAFRKKYDYQVHKVAMYKLIKHAEQEEDV
jgi:hypothetical protein